MDSTCVLKCILHYSAYLRMYICAFLHTYCTDMCVSATDTISLSLSILPPFQESSNIAAQALDLLHQLNPAILKESNELRTGSGLALAQKALHDLHYTDKKVEHVESLMVSDPTQFHLLYIGGLCCVYSLLYVYTVLHIAWATLNMYMRICYITV